jgi:hypothetical protein
VVGDRGAVLADRFGQRFLRHRAVVEQPSVGARFVNRVEVLALDVLDEGHLQQLLVGDLADDDRNAQQPGNLCGAPAALAGDDLEALADAPDDDRLDDAVGADRLGQLLERRLIHLGARLARVGHETVQVDLERRATRRLRGYRRRRGRRLDGRLRDQRAQTATQRRTLLCHSNLF